MKMVYEELIEEAKKTLKFAYAPYSNFKVAAALLTQKGKIYTGVNIENSTYGATVCAERVAIFKAVSENDNKDFEAIAIVTDTSPPSSPCGICRQVMVEFSSDLKIILANMKGEIIETSIKELLPLSFTAEDLKNKS